MNKGDTIYVTVVSGTATVVVPDVRDLTESDCPQRPRVGRPAGGRSYPGLRPDHPRGADHQQQPEGGFDRPEGLPR